MSLNLCSDKEKALNMSSTGKNHFAIIAGICASAASFFGKLSGSADQTVTQLQNIWLLRIVCIVCMIICNAMVWTFFVKALHSKGGSLLATVTSAGTNYCFSAFLGCFMFGEATSALWWLGTLLVLCGLVLLSLDTEKTKENNGKIE